jgi:hypothetical protein
MTTRCHRHVALKRRPALSRTPGALTSLITIMFARTYCLPRYEPLTQAQPMGAKRACDDGQQRRSAYAAFFAR